LVDQHGSCAANLAACRAFDKLTPSISKWDLSRGQVTGDMNALLIAPYNEKEIKGALFQMFSTMFFIHD
jgi:hypothetical protein